MQYVWYCCGCQTQTSTFNGSNPSLEGCDCGGHHQWKGAPYSELVKIAKENNCTILDALMLYC